MESRSERTMNAEGTRIETSIVIVNWNSRDYLKACLSSLSEDLADD